MCQRLLFGRIYAGLQPDFFWDMPPLSGVLLGAALPTAEIVPGETRPGDIDLLVVPYVSSTLLLHRVMAIEIKVTRATFDKPGKSPNDYGFSQAASLRSLGIPYVGVMHCIISDDSPPSSWELMHAYRILDRAGRVERIPDQRVDTLPMKLMDRTYGRLLANAPDPDLGLAAVYMVKPTKSGSAILAPDRYWLPDCRPASVNSSWRKETVDLVADYVERHPTAFLATPRFDPPD